MQETLPPSISGKRRGPKRLKIVVVALIVIVVVLGVTFVWYYYAVTSSSSYVGFPTQDPYGYQSISVAIGDLPYNDTATIQGPGNGSSNGTFPFPFDVSAEASNVYLFGWAVGCNFSGVVDTHENVSAQVTFTGPTGCTSPTAIKVLVITGNCLAKITPLTYPNNFGNLVYEGQNITGRANFNVYLHSGYGCLLVESFHEGDILLFISAQIYYTLPYPKW
jgi:hypothetical protein